MDNYCDLFMMPYNYILDVDLLPRFKKMIEGAILIFDEAHNVPEASCEGRSYELNCSNIKGGIAEIQKTLFAKKISPSLRAIRKVFRARLDDLLGFFENLDTTLLSFMKDIPFLDPPSNAEKRYNGDDPS
jgi:Rad3-related DNA helicase